MKLYATTTSERASKGQGGNKFIQVDFEVEHDDGTREHMGQALLQRVDDSFYLHYAAGKGTSSDEIDCIEVKKAKGNKQKTAKGLECKHGKLNAENCIACDFAN